MKKNINKLFLIMVVVVTAVVCFAFGASASNIDEGKCGENLVWEIDDQCVLTISGIGAMEEHPWDIYKGIVKEVVIEEGVETIVDDAFYDFFNLEKVSIADTVERIESMAFCGCENLIHVALPDDLIYLGSMVFDDCYSLETINIPSKIEVIELFTFASCKSLKEVTIPSSVKTIELGAFQLCENLEELTFEDGIITIEEKAFIGCEKLESVVIPQTVYTIGDSAFAWCSVLKKVEFKSENLMFPAFGSDVFERSKEVFLVGKIGSSVHEYALLNNIRFCDLVNHNIITVDAVEATCSSTGLTEGKKCSGCGMETVKQNVVPATGNHTYSNSCDKICGVCGEERSVKHNYKNRVVIKATLDRIGVQENSCTVCGDIESREAIYYPETIKLSATKYTYNGKAHTPSITVKDSNGKTISKDYYTVKYASGRKNTGKYAVTITFKGKYSGTKTLYFNILPSKTSKITPTCSTTEIKASWSKVTGASGYKVELLNSKGKVVKKVTTTKTYYTFKKLSKVTTYKIRVTAYKTIDKKAVYSGVSTTITTSTAPAKVTLSKVTAGSKSATPAWKTVSGASGYQVQYSTSSKFKSAKTATVSKGSSKKTTIKKLTKGKKYYFKVRAYKTVGSTKVYGAWSSVKNVKVK